jgi:ZIP family zinc transporter
MDSTNILFAMILTTLAGLSTGIGGLFVMFFKKINIKAVSISMGFSAGVMIYISFVELLSESRGLLISSLGEGMGAGVNVISFFGGILLIAVIDKLIPSYENPHESTRISEEIEDCNIECGEKV